MNSAQVERVEETFFSQFELRTPLHPANQAKL